MEKATKNINFNASLSELQDRISSLEATVSDLRNQLTLKEERIQKLLRQLFGCSSERRVLSEQSSAEQLSLDLGEASPPPSTTTESTTEVKGHKRCSSKLVVEGILESDGKYPAELPRVEEILDEGEEAGQIIFRKETERLEIEPPRLFVRKIIRIVRKNDEGIISQPAVPEVITARSTVGPSFLAYIIVSKLLWHLPLNRQEQMLKQYGIKISRDRLIRYVIDVSKLLRPLYELLIKYILEQRQVFADETPVLVGKRGESKSSYTKSYFWPLLGGNQIAVFYSADRRGAKVIEKLKKFCGFLQVDGYRVYEQVSGLNDKLRLVFCWAHARRYFFDAEQHYPDIAKEALRYIQALYRVEAMCKRKKTNAEDTLRLRTRYSKRILVLFKVQLNKWALDRSILPKSSLAIAIKYTLKRWQGLTIYATDPILSIDSNAIERAIRYIALGRRNWMFCASEIGAEALAILYSLVLSSKMCGLNPYEYLKDVLSRIAELNQKDLHLLLPMNWKPLNRPTEQADAQPFHRTCRVI